MVRKGVPSPEGTKTYDIINVTYIDPEAPIFNARASVGDLAKVIPHFARGVNYTIDEIISKSSGRNRLILTRDVQDLEFSLGP